MKSKGDLQEGKRVWAIGTVMNVNKGTLKLKLIDGAVLVKLTGDVKSHPRQGDALLIIGLVQSGRILGDVVKVLRGFDLDLYRLALEGVKAGK